MWMSEILLNRSAGLSGVQTVAVQAQLWLLSSPSSSTCAMIFYAAELRGRNSVTSHEHKVRN